MIMKLFFFLHSGNNLYQMKIRANEDLQSVKIHNPSVSGGKTAGLNSSSMRLSMSKLIMTGNIRIKIYPIICTGVNLCI